MRKKKFTTTNYWQSYSDMMAALLLIFILILAVSFAEMKIQKEDLERQKKEQTETEMRLKAENNKVERMKDLLVERGEEYVNLEDQLRQAHEKLEQIIGIKADIIESLNKQFKKHNMEILLDQKTGAIQFKSEILFDTNESRLLPGGEEYLRKFLPVYFQVLFSSDYKEYISEIIIEGNCDSRGTYEENLVLSQERAASVALYSKELMAQTMNEQEQEEMLKLLNISGRSNKNLIYGSDQKENLDASRRVELKFRLKDEKMIEEMGSILQGGK